MSDAKLTADIIINFNKEMMEKFNEVLKQTEKHLKGMAVASNKVEKAAKENTDEIKKQTKAQKNNNKESKKRASTASKNAIAIGGLTAALARYRVMLGLVQFAAGAMFKAISIPAGILSGWIAFLGITSRGEREINKMARSVQVGTGFLRAFSMATKDAGLSADNAVDMLEEMSNKVGDGLETPTHGTAMAFRTLGLNLKEVQKMSREKGLTKIMDSIVRFRRETGDDQRAVRFADEIFGGEGNKFTGFLLESGELFSELIEKNKQFNLVSEETSSRMDKFSKTLEVTKEMAGGILKEGLSDEVKVWGILLEKFQKFLIDNEEDIVKVIKDISEQFTELSVEIAKVFANKNNLELFKQGINGIIIALKGAVKVLDSALGSWNRFQDAASDIMVGDVEKGTSKLAPVISKLGPAGFVASKFLDRGNSTTNNDNKNITVYVRGNETMTEFQIEKMMDTIEGAELE